jgi:hypothetical protein
MVSGPVTDYAMVISYIQNGSGGDTLWWWIGGGGGWSANLHQHGPFRQAHLTDHDGNTWQPQDDFNRFSDGLSNQLLFGEKHIPAGLVGKCIDEIWADDADPRPSNRVDCSMLLMGEYRGVAAARVVYHRIPSREDKPGIVTPDIQSNDYVLTYRSAFGAVHGSLCNFLIGDGSVRGLTATINVDTLANLGTVDDGNPVTLP